jgi:tRNA (cytidine32/uridine32-2'-O)-methyltransferase
MDILMLNLQQIDIILVETSHPGNIGAVARAMKTMGLCNLILVKPQNFPSAIATARACGADDILASAQIYADFSHSLEPYQLVIATSARNRAINWPQLDPEQCAQRALAQAQHARVAIVFGREDSGLTNAELDHCHFLVQIPTVADFASLNLAAAVQIISYELRRNAINNAIQPTTNNMVDVAQMEDFYQHLQQVLFYTGFSQADNPRLTMRKLRRLFNRAAPNQSEINILRGILTSVQKLPKN